MNPYIIELCSALERTLSYGHTGNGKVLARAVMDPLFLTRGLIQNGMPTLNKQIYQMPLQASGQLTVLAAHWPLTKQNHPAICSKRCQVLTYGETHFQVSIILS